MLRNYLLLGFRNLAKRKLYSFINIAGLSLALGCSLVCFAFVNFFYTADQFHEKVEKIFLVERESLRNGKGEISGKSPVGLAHALRELPQVDEVMRVTRKAGLITIGDETFEELFTYADPNFFDLLTFPIAKGSSDNWNNGSIILSQESAKKYFGNDDPTGRSVVVRMPDSEGREVAQSFTIGGVAKDFPRNASFRFRVLLPFDFQLKTSGPFDEWRTLCDATFILVNGTDVAAMQAGIQRFIEPYNKFNPDFPLTKFHLEPLTTASLNSYKVDDDVFGGAPTIVFIILMVISFFLLVMACFNYMNIAIATAAFRLKEIGIRKVMGGRRSQLIRQFVSENFILCSLALILGLILAEVLFVPVFSSYFGVSIALDYASPALWGTCLGLSLFAAIGGAGYPALYISSFQPAQVLKDRAVITGKSVFRRLLLGFQFFLSYVSITTAVAFTLNTNFQHAKDWGYDPADRMIIRIEDPAVRTAMKNELLQQPYIVGVAGSVQPLGSGSLDVVLKINSDLHTIDNIRVGTGFIELMNIGLVKGETFHSDNESGNVHSVVVNESFTKIRGMEDPVGKPILINDQEFTVAGIVRDFHFEPFTELIKPLVLSYAAENDYSNLAVHYREGNTDVVTGLLKTAWKKISPERPLLMYAQGSVFDHTFRSFDTATQVMRGTAFVTVLIGIFGLFGLSSLALSSKVRQLAIRKVLGGNMVQLGWIMNREIVWLLGVACLAGMPLSYLFLKRFLLNVSLYAMPLELPMFIATFIMLIAVAAVSVSVHLYRLSVIVPVKYLKEE